MNGLIVKPVASADEFARAYDIALSVFAENSTIDHYADHKIATWTKDPSFAYQNILLARYAKEYIGLIRIVPRILFRGNLSYRVAGISSVCLLPSFRGKGLSVPLMNQALAYCKERGYDIAFLFARRAADHYYTKFGFHGVASYAKVFIKNNLSSGQNSLFSLADMDTGLVNLYAKAYERSYRDCFGRIERLEAYWQFLLSSIKGRNDCIFKTIFSDGIPIGYLIYNKYKILEIAFDIDVDGKILVNFLLQQDLFDIRINILELEILPQHLLMGCLKNMDITSQLRECNYGGHMLKIINTQKMIGIGKPVNDIYNYEETCRMMGIFSPTSISDSQIGALPFDIGYIDQF